MIPTGFSFSAINAGVKSPQHKGLDMGLIFCDKAASVAGVFTSNQVKAAPVIIGMDLVKTGRSRCVVVNSGNANACTGIKGIEDARAITAAVADRLGVGHSEVIPLSTGVIGIGLPVERMLDKTAEMINGLGDDIHAFSRCIMTTDTFPKIAFRQAGNARVLGFAKGAGMIAPDMATTLAIVLTDADIGSQVLDNMVKRSVASTFNAISIDGDTSTNDTLIALASGYVSEDISKVEIAIHEVIQELAMMIVRDGEGATKVVEISVTGTVNDGDAKTVAMSIANSLLVKTALFGCDPNWGRIIAAIGYSGVCIEPHGIEITINGYTVVEYGVEAAGFDENTLHDILQNKEIAIAVSLGKGSGGFKVFTTDLSYKYVEINSEYRT
ncbi:MAG TPA: bifunctional glutamate N-acetyltransferase/amino-acid acetyltransferase ArgJ [Deltaproteobacteria bacterium]|nr:bifunctional glutamate N-acetyltransferase/amino-acid acetyltransferase ArgJ [Deltaproteobacteria bacterium]